MLILIIEDNLSFAINLEKNLIDWGNEVLGIVDNAEDAKRLIEGRKPSLILMDINIKGPENGLDVALSLKDQKIPIIFTTGRNDEATFKKAKEVNAISFLVKPFDILSLKGILDLHPALTNKKKSPNHIYLKKNREFIKIFPENIIYIQSDKNYCDIYTKDAYYIHKTSLKKMLQILPEELFIKVHKSFVVNVSSIKSINPSNNTIKIKNIEIPLGRNFKKKVLNRFEIYNRKIIS